MFYVKECEVFGDIEVAEVELIEKRGTWHYWQDKNSSDSGRKWRSRGLGYVRVTKLAAIRAYAKLDPEDCDRAIKLAYAIGNDQGWHEGYKCGKSAGRVVALRELRAEARERENAPKPRSFLRRLIACRPFASA